MKSFYNKTYCICLFLDLYKVFSTVNVEILDEKLKMCGIRGTASLLIGLSMSYVTHILSDVLPANAGVSQGSDLYAVYYNMHNQ